MAIHNVATETNCGDEQTINHITLTTGHLLRSSSAAVSAAVRDVLSPLIQQALEAGKPIPLPFDGLSNYTVEMHFLSGGLFATVYAGKSPLITMAVAQNPRQVVEMWEILVSNYGAHPAAKRPEGLMCAVSLHPALYCDFAALEWLGDFERCIAWAWIKRSSTPKSEIKENHEAKPVNTAKEKNAGVKPVSQFLTINNKGQAIANTNYWDSDHAQAGNLFLSWNAGAARLLVPDNQKHIIREMRSAKYVVISRGSWADQGGRDALELLFEDNSDSHFSIQLVSEQCDRLLPESNQGGGFFVTIWTRGGEKLRLPGKYRTVEHIPCLQEWVSPAQSTRKNAENVQKNNPRQVIKDQFASIPHMLVDHPYHSPLPPDLAEWYCYIIDGGCSILCLLECFADEAFATNSVHNYMVPVCVKTVLRGYQMREGYVVVNVICDNLLGVVCDKDDYEFTHDDECLSGKEIEDLVDMINSGAFEKQFDWVGEWEMPEVLDSAKKLLDKSELSLDDYLKRIQAGDYGIYNETGSHANRLAGRQFYAAFEVDGRLLYFSVNEYGRTIVCDYRDR